MINIITKYRNNIYKVKIDYIMNNYIFTKFITYLIVKIIINLYLL